MGDRRKQEPGESTWHPQSCLQPTPEGDTGSGCQRFYENSRGKCCGVGYTLLFNSS